MNHYKYKNICVKFHVMARLRVYSRFLVPHTRISNPDALAILLNSYPNLVRDYPHLKDVDFDKETKIELDKIHEEVDRQHEKKNEIKE